MEVNAAKFGPKTIKSVKELLMGKFSEQVGFDDSRSEWYLLIINTLVLCKDK